MDGYCKPGDPGGYPSPIPAPLIFVKPPTDILHVPTDETFLDDPNTTLHGRRLCYDQTQLHPRANTKPSRRQPRGTSLK